MNNQLENVLKYLLQRATAQSSQWLSECPWCFESTDWTVLVDDSKSCRTETTFNRTTQNRSASESWGAGCHIRFRTCRLTARPHILETLPKSSNNTEGSYMWGTTETSSCWTQAVKASWNSYHSQDENRKHRTVPASCSDATNTRTCSGQPVVLP